MPESNDQVLVDLHDGVQAVTLNQPTKFNALSATMVKAFSDVLRAAERDDSVRSLVITGAGKGFCSGADVTEFRPGDGQINLGHSLRTGLTTEVTRMHTMQKPLLPAINGVAAGGRLRLAPACQLRCTAESHIL